MQKKSGFSRVHGIFRHSLNFQRSAAVLGCAVLLSASVAFAAPLTRVPNTTLKMPAKPPTFGYTHANAFGSLTFTNPIALVTPPGETNRLFVVQKNGVITVITNLASPTRSVFMDISSKVTFTASNGGGSGEQGLLGLAFHPGYRTNRFFYVFYTGQSSEGSSGLHDIIARYQISSSNTNQGLASSEVKIISQYDRDVNHNAGDLHFGPDGYLYISVGDEGAEHDGRTNAQQIARNMFSGILRIDVDKKSGNLTPNSSPTSATTSNYLIPNDNPWIGITHFDDYNVSASQVRTEFYAVGLRNPFRFSFDPVTGAIWCGDVGQDQYEEIDYITKGGNYGWAWYEGNTTPPLNMSTSGRPRPTNPIPPIITYSHGSGSTQGNCVIGGVVYRGQKLSQLYGHYVFADYVSGNFWEINANNTNGTISTPQPIFSDSTLHPTAFGVDPRNGDVLFTAEKTTGTPNGATIERISYNTATNGTPIPPTLAETGAFSDLTSLTPNAGIVPYNINVPFWSDNAIKSRWFSVPNTSLDITFSPTNNWSFPTGTVWIKHFELELTNGVPSSRKRIETRLIVKNSTGVYGVTYRWGTSTTNATLVAEGGLDESFVINDGGILRTQVWHYPSRNECNTCHTPEGGFGLGFRTEQLNMNYTYSGGTTNQIQAYSDAGYFTTPVNDTSTLLALAHATNTSASLEFRSRSFLMANCSQCHQPGGSAVQALWDARITTPITKAGIINGALDDNFNDSANHVVTPLSTAHSVLLSRVATRGFNSIEMPPLDSNLVSDEATNLLTAWINSMTNNFWISASPYSRTLTAGGANQTFSISSLGGSGFSGSVALSVSGLPSGMTASFSPTSVTPPASSTLTVSADGTTTAGTYTLTVVGTSGGITASDTITVKANSNASTLPAPWTDADVGSVGVAGDASYSGGTFTVDGSGADIWGTADGFNFVSQPTTNDVTITARVASQEATAAWAKCGVMIRESTAANASYVGLYVTPSNGVSMQFRSGTGTTAIDLVRQTGKAVPYWVRLVRSGNTFTGFSSPDGTTWTQVGTTNVTMTAAVRSGLVVCSHANTTLNTSTFNNVSVTTPTSDFSISGSPGSQTVTAGSSTTYTATVSAINGFSGAVSLSASGLPSGATATFNPTSITSSGSSAMTVTTLSSTPVSTNTVVITGTSGSLSHSDNVTLIVSAASGGGTLYEAEDIPYVTNGAPVVVQNDTAASSGQWISFNADGVNDYIEFTLTNVPSGIYDLSFLYKKHPNRGILSLSVDGTVIGSNLDEYTASPFYTEQDFGNVTFNTDGDDHQVRLTVAGKNSASTVYTLSADAFRLTFQGAVTPQTNFSLSVSPTSQTVVAGNGSVDYAINSIPTNFNSSVTLSVSGLPGGATASFNANPITPPGSSTMSILADGSTAPGTYSLTITGTGGGITNSIPATLVVVPPSGAQLYEAELLPIATNGATANYVTDSLASGGVWVSLLAVNAGPYFEYTVTNVTPGTYDLTLLYKRHPNRGILSLTVDGVKLGDDFDEYGSTVAYLEQDFGGITFTDSGDHVIRLTAVGKNPSAGNYNLAADAFRLTPTNQVWLDQDIGAVGLNGSFSENNGTFTVVGSGSDIWTAADQFNYGYQNLSGDFVITARVVSEQQTATYAKAGVMIRASLATNSPEASVLLTPTNGVAMEIRPTTGASSINVTGWVKGPVPPYWVQLARSGNAFTASVSPDGSTWTQLAQTNVTMSGGVTAGLAVTSHDNTKANTATFDNVALPDDSFSASSFSAQMSIASEPLTLQPSVLTVAPESNGRIGALSISGPAAGTYVIEASSNLVDWEPIFHTNASLLPFNWQDSKTNQPQRFYRVRVQ